MSSSTNVYDMIITVGPPVVVAVVSLLSVRASYNRQRNDQRIDLRLEKAESLYKSLLEVHGEILAATESFKRNESYTVAQQRVESIAKRIVLLKIQAKLYFRIVDLELLSMYAMGLLELMSPSDSPDTVDRTVLEDGQYGEHKGHRYAIVPSTFEQRLGDYTQAVSALEDRILRQAQRDLAGHKLLHRLAPGVRRRRRIKRRRITPSGGKGPASTAST